MSDAAAIGIDPGFGGGLGIIRPDGRVTVHDLPTMLVEGSTKDHNEYNLVALRELLLPFLGTGTVVGVEFVRGIPHIRGEKPKQGSTSIWLQGHGVGAIEGLVTGVGLRALRVAPQRWRAALHGRAIPGDDKKEASRYLAINLFPAVAGELSRKKDHGRSEGLLIAEYIRRELAGGHLE